MIPLLAAIVTLETDTTRIGFDPDRNGAIVSVVDKATGRDFAAPKTAAPLLYELRFTNAPSLTEATPTPPSPSSAVSTRTRARP